MTIFQGRTQRGWSPGRLELGAPSETVTVLEGSEDPFGGLAALPSRARGKSTGGGPPAFPLVALAIKYEFGAHLGLGAGPFHRLGDSREWLLHAALHEGPVGPGAVAEASRRRPADLVARMAYPEYVRRVESIREGIRSGALYQANLAVPFEWRGGPGAQEAFARGVELGGAEFAALMPVPDGTIVCFSPELFVRVRGREIETRPIKGTRAIGEGEAEGAALRELLASEKDRAEHTMIVDLERNDLGRLCEPGSIRVDPCMEGVVHPTVVHLESTVRGRLREGVGLREILEATFPGGSVTGAPKRAALEWIRRHEDGPRGIFCGAVGWMDAAGDMDLALPIRTGMFGEGGGMFHAGGGITIDSDPAEEWAEVHAKAAFFRRVLGSADVPSRLP